MKIARSLLLIPIFFAITAVCIAQSSDGVTYHPNQTKDSTKRSIKARAVGIVDGDTVTVNYHSPGVRGRTIWGGLVPFGEVWVTGAHSATAIDFPADFTVGTTTIPAGRYALFTIPGRDEWTIILNKNWEQHLADDYDAKEDVVRIQVKPQEHAHTERLEYFVEPLKDRNGKIAVAWEKLMVTMPFTFKK